MILTKICLIIIYINIHWPDFDEKDLRKAIFDFQKRNRRYGGI